MANIGWGKCRIFIKTGSGNWKEVSTPTEGSTVLSVTKGDKKEAKIEGGENEDVRYNRNNYALSYTIRAAKNRTKPVEDVNGIISGDYVVMVQPEDPDVNGFELPKTRMSIEDGFSTDEGGYWTYTHDALKGDSNSDPMIVWGKVSVSGTGDNLTVTIA